MKKIYTFKILWIIEVGFTKYDFGICLLDKYCYTSMYGFETLIDE